MHLRAFRTLSPMGFRLPKARYLRLRLPNWRGKLRVAQLSDLHFGRVTPLALQVEAVALANEARPDLTVLTGDFVARCLRRRYLDRLTGTLAGLESPAFAVLGNHDHRLGAAQVWRALERAGVHVLRNSWLPFGHGRDRLALVGLDDVGTRHDDIQRATQGLRGAALGLSHNPKGAPLLWKRGVSLVLAGHTHGGQFQIGQLTHQAMRHAAKQRYVAGWHREGDKQVYVNPGIGSSLFPWRRGTSASRQVAILDLEGGPVSAAVIRPWDFAAPPGAEPT